MSLTLRVTADIGLWPNAADGEWIREARFHDGCTNCMRCVEVCPSDALGPAFPKLR
ncbi:MAG: 4Fe-4S binding protein [Terriglobales bacterium]